MVNTDKFLLFFRYKTRENLILWNQGVSIAINDQLKYGNPSSDTLIDTMISLQNTLMHENDKENEKHIQVHQQKIQEAKKNQNQRENPHSKIS